MVSQTEMVRPSDIGLDSSDFEFINDTEIRELISLGGSICSKKR